MIEVLALVIAFTILILLIVVFYYRFRVKILEQKYNEVKRKLDSLKTELRREVEDEVRREYESKFRQWLSYYEEKIRRDAIERSIATILGKVGEQLAPILISHTLGIDPRDLRFLGSPVDYIAFKGLSSGYPQEILFIEIKTSRNTPLTDREKAVKKLVDERKVRWITIRLKEEIEHLVKKVIEEKSELIR